jgi:hypothetical protein
MYDVIYELGACAVSTLALFFYHSTALFSQGLLVFLGSFFVYKAVKIYFSVTSSSYPNRFEFTQETFLADQLVNFPTRK